MPSVPSKPNAVKLPPSCPATLRPIRDKVVCRRIDAPTHKGSILLPESSRSKQLTNEVVIVATGPDIKGDIPLLHRAFISHYAGADVEIDDLKYVIVSEEDVLAICEH